MRILIAGADGYLGWSLSVYLASRGHDVLGLDNGSRRQWVSEVGSSSVVPIAAMAHRSSLLHLMRRGSLVMRTDIADLGKYGKLAAMFEQYKPEAVVQLAECPSAPYSMRSVEHTRFVQENNIGGTWALAYALRDFASGAHLVKLGSMGEYGTPGLPIPEGHCRLATLADRTGAPMHDQGPKVGAIADVPFPRQPGSFYHAGKVATSVNLELACKAWGSAIRVTDIMQGVVYGTSLPEFRDYPELRTRFDYDEFFGTAINRFCAQTVAGHPMTVYGAGGQTRGYLPLADSMRCLELLITNPPEAGEYRVVNQLRRTYSLLEIAERVQGVAEAMGVGTSSIHLENPRVEAEEHEYEVDTSTLRDLGYEPTEDLDETVAGMLEDLSQFRHRIDVERLTPRQRWNGEERECEALS